MARSNVLAGMQFALGDLAADAADRPNRLTQTKEWTP